jgi:uncharacterized membrane protein
MNPTTIAPAKDDPADRREAQMDRLVGSVLLVGVALSVILVSIGLVWGWIRHGYLGVHYEIPRTNLLQFVVADIRLVLAGEFRPRLFVSLGIAALLLTPYIRVAASLAFFACVEHNGKYSAITAFVLIVLSYSLLLR